MKQRAMAPQDKQIRRERLLDAARALFQDDSRLLPPVTRIAEQAGIAKGTIYLYFSSKEEIFATLLEEYTDAFLKGLRACLESSPDATAVKLERFVDYEVSWVIAHPAFLRLAGMANCILEQNLSPEQIHAHKLHLAQNMRRTGEILERHFPQLRVGEGARLVLRSHALAKGMWQSLDYPQQVASVMDDPALAMLRPDLAQELRAALRQLWCGALTEAEAGVRDDAPAV